MSDDQLGPGLEQRMESMRDNDQVDVNIFLKGEHSRELALHRTGAADAAVLDGPAMTSTASSLRERCRDEQQDLISMLTSAEAGLAGAAYADAALIDDMGGAPVAPPPITSYWINNSVAAAVSGRMLKELLKRPDVAYIDVDRHVDLEELLDAKKKAARKKATRKRASKKTARKKATRKKASRKRSSGSSRSASRSPSAMVETASGGLRIGGVADVSTITWSVNRVNAPRLWSAGVNGKGVVVAVIDTGVNYRHPDLKQQMWKGGPSFPNHGYNFAENNNDPMDQHGHGTACAGQVAGSGVAGEKTGVAPEATIMAIRVGGRERNFWDGMQFAITHNADVISMSMSWKYPSAPNYPGWRRVCESVLAAGILHANSIGNQGDDLSTYPIPFNIATPGNCPPPRLHPLQSIQGGLSSAISCGATDDLDRLAGYSGRGPAEWNSGPFTDYPWNSGVQQGLIKPDVCAPGPGTTSCNWRYSGSGSASPYRPFGGTSAATPHVGGCLALLAHACQKAGTPIEPARIQEALENTAVRVAGQLVDKENHYGAGRVDVHAAYLYGQARGWW